MESEILYRIDRLPDGRRKELLHSTASEVFAAFEDQALPFDSSAARPICAAPQAKSPDIAKPLVWRHFRLPARGFATFGPSAM